MLFRSTSHPSTAASHQRFTRQQFGQMTWVLNSSTVNVIKAGYSTFNRNNDPLVKTNGGKNQFMTSLRDGAPIRINFRGYTAGTVVQHHNQDLVSFRDDLTTAVNARGRHELKTGVEYIHNLANLIGCGSLCSPRIIAQNGAPTTLPLARIFPVWNDAGTWNINLIAPVAQRYEASYTDVPGFFRDIVQHNVGAWLQDDWKVASKFTLNLGLRYDMQNHVGPELNLSPFLPGDRGTFHNWAPRVGFAYTVTDRTVVRGGYEIGRAHV